MALDSSPQRGSRLSLACPWLKRLGLAGFMFFLVKGLLWLTVPGLLVYFGFQD